MVFEGRYNLFGATVDDVAAYLPGASLADAATVRRTVMGGSEAGVLVVDSTEGFAAGDRVHAVVGGHDEVRRVDEVAEGGVLVMEVGFSGVPAVGGLVDNGPELIWRELVRAESFVVSKLPERYRRLLERVEGEIVVRCATAGQREAVLGLGVARNVRLYRNFEGMLEDLGRGAEMGGGSWSVEGQAVSFDPGLCEGDRVLASYDVSVERLCILQTLVVDLATYRVGRRLLGQFSKVSPEWLLSFRERGEEVLEEIFSSGRGVAELDGLVLYEDWERRGGGLRCGRVVRG